MHKVKKDVYLVGEDWDDTAPYMDGDIWDGTMNYYGSGRPLRSWMGQRDRFLSEGTGHSAGEEEPWNGVEESEGLMEAMYSVSDQNVFFQMNLFDSHDTPRLHNDKAVFDRDIYKGVVMALYMLPGMPNLYYGDEVLLNGKLGSNEGARYPMEWRDEYQDKDMLSFYSKMGEARKEEWLGFSSYSVIPLDEKAFAILRFIEGKALVSVINRGDSREVSLPPFLLPSKKISVVVGDGKVTRECDSFRIILKDKESLLIRLEN